MEGDVDVLLNHDLGNTRPDGDADGCPPEVFDDEIQLAAVVAVDDACLVGKAQFGGEPRAAAQEYFHMVALGYLEGKSCVDEVRPLSCAVRRDVGGLRCVDIKTGCAVGLTLGQSDARMEAVDFDGDGLGLVG